MRTSIMLGVVATVALATAALSTPALAGKKKSDLVAAGYKCERVGVNFTECTKNGATTYWCDDTGNCEPKPTRIRGDGLRALMPGILEINPGLGTQPPAGIGTLAPKAPPVQLQ
jgi:hypothetical protein